MEILKLEGLNRITLDELKVAIWSRTTLPVAQLIRVAGDRGVIPCEDMIQLRKKFGQPARQFMSSQ